MNLRYCFLGTDTLCASLSPSFVSFFGVSCIPDGLSNTPVPAYDLFFSEQILLGFFFFLLSSVRHLNAYFVSHSAKTKC